MAMRSEQKTIDSRQALLNAVGHELNTPLTSVLIHLRFLEGHTKKMEPEMEKSIKILVRSVNRLQGRVQDIIAVSRLDSDPFPSRTEDTENVETDSIGDAMAMKNKQKTDDFRQALLNAVEHELNTPMAPVLIHLRFLEERAKEMDPNIEKSIKIVVRNVIRLQGRIQDIIVVSRLESARFPIRIEDVEIGPIVEEAMEEFRTRCDNDNLVLELKQVEGHRVLVDRRRFLSVLHNLMDNACRFTPSGGSIKVMTRFERNWFIVEVQDTGVGFLPAEKERLFEPFSHLDHPVAHAYSGAGLGLHVSKGIVRLHGGTIWGHSEGRDKGATFGFRIPASSHASPQSLSQQTPSANGSSAKGSTGWSEGNSIAA